MPMLNDLPIDVRRYRLLNLIFLSLNIGYASAFALRTYLDLWPGMRADGLYSSLNQYFHYPRWNDFGLVFTFVAAMLLATSITLALFLIISRFGSPAVTRAVLDPVACLLAITAAPACWIGAIEIGGGRYLNWWDIYPMWFGRQGFWSLAFEAAFILIFLYVARRRNKTFGYSLVILLAHYSFWAWYMWPAIREDIRWHPILQYCSVVCPASGLAWLFYVTALRERESGHSFNVGRDLVCVMAGAACGQFGRVVADSVGPLAFPPSPESRGPENIVSALAFLLFLLFAAGGFGLCWRFYLSLERSLRAAAPGRRQLM